MGHDNVLSISWQFHYFIKYSLVPQQTGTTGQWWMQDLRKGVSDDPRTCAQAKFLEATPIFAWPEAHCLLNQQGLGWPAHQFNRWSWTRE
jgi:hypothetical protein